MLEPINNFFFLFVFSLFCLQTGGKFTRKGAFKRREEKDETSEEREGDEDEAEEEMRPLDTSQ